MRTKKVAIIGILKSEVSTQSENKEEKNNIHNRKIFRNETIMKRGLKQDSQIIMEKMKKKQILRCECSKI